MRIVARYRLDNLADLARQMSFTPPRARAAQLSAAEDLLHSIDPAKAYPFDFVLFRITGYRPRTGGDGLVTGLALQHDLGLLVEQLSDSLDVQTTSLAEPVLTIEDVTERFNVTSKTIQRWRRRGLPARKFLFPDGKRRVGFLVSSVERFFATHREQVSRGTNFSQVNDREREEILRRARRLAMLCQCCMHEIARRIARRLNRSPLTVLHTIRKHDAEQPQQAIFARAADSIGEQDRSRIVKAHRHGLSIKSLAKRLCRPRSAIYRVIVEERLARLSRRKVRFIDDPLYHQPEARQAIDAILSQEDISHQSRPEEMRIPRDLPAYLQELYRTPLLSPSKERALFLKFNFHKFEFVQARRRIEPQFARARDIGRLESLWRSVAESKNEIVRANLRLVVSVARKHLRPNLSLMELISDGNLTLMRAVESFDLHRGHRFSTYATLALMKGFARSVPMMLAAQRSSHMEVLPDLPDPRNFTAADRSLERDELRQLLARLTERERTVLLAHYGISLGDPATSSPATYEQVARRLGVSKQRVRQIEQVALSKLRAQFEPSVELR
jgi:RNA polymerase primary sigma factor